ncbi:uncharacterized protein LOC135143605 [Zophobas morio]|uniref:uncharacterized protein LOC135143605 n=1 Tax=Zophobas morio TaxID=2755281 RepID=UPI0030831626
MFPLTWRTTRMVVEVRFNPVSKTVLKKTLRSFGKDYNLKIPVDLLDELSMFGDVRAAFATLQFLLIGKNLNAELEDSRQSLAFCGRTLNKTLYQLLGSILHAKRIEPSEPPVSFFLRPELARNPLKLDIDEALRNMSASPENLCLHLHENMCNFSDDIESLCKAADYLSHADMLVQWQHSFSRLISLEVAMRGTLFANRTSGRPRGWVTVRPPAWYESTRKAVENHMLILDTWQYSFSENSNAVLRKKQLFTELAPFGGLLSRAPVSEHFRKLTSFSKSWCSECHESESEPASTVYPLKRAQSQRRASRVLFLVDDDIEEV